jgi:hypothetical protein
MVLAGPVGFECPLRTGDDSRAAARYSCPVRTQVVVGAVAGAVVGAALLVALRLYDGAAAFASDRVTLLRIGCGACFVALGAWLLVRSRARTPGRGRPSVPTS